MFEEIDSKEIQKLEKRLTVSNEGRMSSMLLSNLRPILDLLTQEVLVSIKQDFREGKPELSKMLANSARLCTLEDIEIRLKQKIKVAERLGEENI